MPQTKVQRMEIGGQLYDIIVPKNWNQSDYTAVDYIENRTHYIIPQKNNDGSLAQLLITAGAGQFGNLLTKFSPKLTIGDWVLIETEADNAVENPETGLIQPATARYEISKLIRVGSSENNALTFDYEGTCTASIEVQAGANAADDVKFSGFIIRNKTGERDSNKKFKYAIKISKVEVSPLAAAYIPLDEESLTINNAGKISTVRQDELRYSGTIDAVTQINSEWVYNVAIDSSDKSELAKVFLSEYKKEYPATLADVSNFNKNLTLRFHTKDRTGYFIKATSQFTSDDKVEIDNRDNRVLPKDAIEALDKDSKQYLLHIDTANITGNSETHIQKNILDGLCFIVGPGCNTGHVTGDNDNCFELQAGDLVVILNGEPIRLRSTTNLALAPGSAQGALRGGAVDTSSITALSLNSFAYGYANFAGGKGFKIVGQRAGETADTGTYNLTSVDGIEPGQNYIVRLSSVSRTLSGKILEVDFESNTVLVDNYNSNLVIEFDDYNFEENNDFSTNPSACNYLCILEHPELGDISVGFNAVTFGEYNIASERGAVSFGRKNKSLGQYAFTEGYLNEANYGSHAEGHQNKASGVTAHAEGREGTASGYASHSEGAKNTASGEAAHAEGCQTAASGYYSHSEGHLTQAIGSSSHAEGDNDTAADNNKQEAVSIPTYTFNSTTDTLTSTSTVKEISNNAKGPVSHREGRFTSADGAFSHAEGYRSVAMSQSAHAEGDMTIANGASSHAEGIQTIAIGEASHSEGYGNNAIGDRSHAEGSGSIALGFASHAEGQGANAIGTAAHAEGNGTKAIAENAHAEGQGTTAKGAGGAHAEGNLARALGESSHAEGRETLAEASYSHAEGYLTQAKGLRSHAEGDKSAANFSKTLTGNIATVYGNATGHFSHREGRDTESYGQGSHAEGQKTTAYGGQSHAEGYNTEAIGAYSHAEGNSTIALGTASHASGIGTKATADYQTVIGKYNKDDPAIFIVGCGTGDAANQRANALTVNGSDKKTTLFGSLEVKGTSTLQDSLIVASGKTTTLGGATTIKGAFTVADGSKASLTGPLKVTGKTELDNILTVADKTTLSKTLEVTDKTTLNGGLELKGRLDVSEGSIKLATGTNNITISGNLLTSTAPITIENILTTTAATTLGADLSVAGDTSITGTLTVDNTLTAKQINSTEILSTTGGLDASGGTINLDAGTNEITISGNITTINSNTTVTDTDLTTKIVNAEKLCIGSNYENSDADALLVVGNGTETEPNTAFVIKPDGTGYLNNRKILVEGTNEGSLESNSITTKQLIIGDTELPESILVKLIQIAESVEFEGVSGGAEVYI